MGLAHDINTLVMLINRYYFSQPTCLFFTELDNLREDIAAKKEQSEQQTSDLDAVRAELEGARSDLEKLSSEKDESRNEVDRLSSGELNFSA